MLHLSQCPVCGCDTSVDLTDDEETALTAAHATSTAEVATALPGRSHSECEALYTGLCVLHMGLGARR